MLVPVLLLRCDEGYRVSIPGEFESEVVSANVQEAMDQARKLASDEEWIGRYARAGDFDAIWKIGRELNCPVCVVKAA